MYLQAASFLHKVTKHFAETVPHQLMDEDPPHVPFEGRKSRDQRKEHSKFKMVAVNQRNIF